VRLSSLPSSVLSPGTPCFYYSRNFNRYTLSNEVKSFNPEFGEKCCASVRRPSLRPCVHPELPVFTIPAISIDTLYGTQV
jgi:hypothetical protein